MRYVLQPFFNCARVWLVLQWANYCHLSVTLSSWETIVSMKRQCSVWKIAIWEIQRLQNTTQLWFYRILRQEHQNKYIPDVEEWEQINEITHVLATLIPVKILLLIKKGDEEKFQYHIHNQCLIREIYGS